MKKGTAPFLILALVAGLLLPALGIGLTNLSDIHAPFDGSFTDGHIYYGGTGGAIIKDGGAQSIEASSPTASGQPPTAPKTLAATAGNAQVRLTWQAPATDHGSPVTNYTIRRGVTPSHETFLIMIGNVLTYTDLGLTNGQIYYYIVSALNANGEGAYSNEAFVTPATVPSAPLSPMAIAGNSQINLTWSPPANNGGSAITNYTIYRSITSGTETFLKKTGNILTYIDTALTNGQIYYYKVSANNSAGESASSDEAWAVPATVPSAPRGLLAAAGNAAVELNWTAPSYTGPGTLTFHLFRDGSLIWSNTGLAHTDTAVTNGISYSYKVAAQNSIGWGPNCTEVQATPQSGNPVPTAPRGLTAMAGNSLINLNWSAPSSDGGSVITNYKVYRGVIAGGETLLTTVGDVLIYSDTSVTNGQIYYYKVSAVNAAGEGAQSDESSATPATVPNAPQNLITIVGNAKMTLNWDAPSSTGGRAITSYKIYRGLSAGGETLLTTVGTVFTYVDPGLTNGVTYYYEVSAVNAVGEGTLSNEASAIPATVPTAPTLSSATPGNGQVALTWTAPSSNGGSTIIGYRLYRGTTPGGETLLTPLGNLLTFTDTGLTNGQVYYYKVSAVNSVGEGVQSNELNAKPVGSPSAPTNLQAIPGDAFVNLTWQTPSSDGGSAITNYQVWRSTTSGTETYFANVGLKLWYNNTGLTNGQTYYYKVRAENIQEAGPYSNEASATPSQTTTVPTAPRSLVATAGNAQVVLTWSAPLSDGGASITGYKVYRGTTSGGETLYITLGNIFQCTNTGLTNGQIYYYKVSAVNSIGEGAQSNEVSATPATVPTAPSLSSATPGNSQVVLTWIAPSSNGGSPITSYKVYRGTISGGETLLTTLGNVLTCTDTGLSNGQVYYYKVSAINSKGEGALSNEISAIPSTVPSTPQSFVATSGNAQVTLTWSVPTSNGGSSITGYKVYRGTTSGGETLLTNAGNVLTYSDTTVSNGQTYYYKVSAVNSVGEGGQSNELSATPATVPGAPTLTSTIPGPSQIVLSWSVPSSDGGSSITGYKVYCGTTSGGETLLATLGNVLTCTDSYLTNGQIYYYKVSAVNAVGEGAQSNELSATPTTVPTAPTLNSASPGVGQVVLFWTAPSSDGGSSITNYKILRSQTSGGEVEIQQVGNFLTWTDSTVSNGLTYYYKVQAVSAIGLSPLSNEMSAKPVGPPMSPQNLQASPGDTFVNLSWQAPTSDGGSPITNYQVWRGISSGTEVFLSNAGLQLWYNDTGLINDQIFYYMVKAENAQGAGPFSGETIGTPSQIAVAPSAPQNLQAIGGNNQTTLDWQSPSNNGGSPITNYNVYRGNSSGGETLLTTLENILTYIDTGVANGQIYYYTVSAVNAVGEGAYSNEAFAIPSTVPTAPTISSASPGDGRVSLTWTVPSYDGGDSITNFTVFRGLTPGGEFPLVMLGNVLTYNDTGLTNGQIYYYEVSAVNSVGEGLRSHELNATPVGPPTAPQNLQASPGDAFINLTWSPPANDGGSAITNYRVWRSSSSGAEILYTNTGLNLWFNDTVLTNGQSYYYKVTAENAQGIGPNSSEAFAIPNRTITLPSAPQNLTAALSNAQVILNWTAPSIDGGSVITNYKIYRRTTEGGESLLTTVGDVLTYADTAVTNGLTYYYKVSAVNAMGEGGQSNEAAVTPATIPTAPTINSAIPGNAQVTLTWSTPVFDGGSPITNYRIYRGTTPGGETLFITLDDVLAYSDIGLANGQIYYYRLSALNAMGEGPLSNGASATPTGVPIAPRGLHAVPGNSAVYLNWTAPSYTGPGTLIYLLFRDGQEIWRGTVMIYEDASLTKGVQHYYNVAAQNSIGLGPNCTAVYATPVGVPDAPWGLNAVPGNEQVALSWNVPNYSGPGILTYHLFRDSMEIWSDVTTSHLDVGLVNGEMHHYAVAASNDVGSGASSSAAEAMPQGPPTAPLGLHAEAGNRIVQLNWTAPQYLGLGSTVYHLSRDGALIWSGTELEYIDSGLTNLVTYSYKVSAENSIGWGPNCTAIQTIPIIDEDQSATPWTPVAIVGFVAIGVLPVSVLTYVTIRIRKK